MLMPHRPQISQHFTSCYYMYSILPHLLSSIIILLLILWWWKRKNKWNLYRVTTLCAVMAKQPLELKLILFCFCQEIKTVFHIFYISKRSYVKNVSMLSYPVNKRQNVLQCASIYLNIQGMVNGERIVLILSPATLLGTLC